MLNSAYANKEQQCKFLVDSVNSVASIQCQTYHLIIKYHAMNY